MKPKKKKTKIKLIIGIITIVVLYLAFIVPMKVATIRYNRSVQRFNEVAEEYNSCTERVSVDNIYGLPVILNPLKIEKIDFFSIIKSIFHGNSIAKINSDINTMNLYVDDFRDSINVLKQIENPKTEWVLQKLKKADYVTATETVNKENDPDGLLETEGGYTGCIYFSVSKLDATQVEGNTIVEKGTDGGGCIEIYTTKKEAENRCEYLKQFDGTILYSGSYAIVGTMVIRTSFMLSDYDQFDITYQITQELTKTE